MTLIICPGPSVEIARRPIGLSWCFRCRKRLPHDYVVLDDPPERQPSYYEPVGIRECTRCSEDHTSFPG